VNEQELFLNVGELAFRIGSPMPSVTVIDNLYTPYVRVRRRGAVGPTLEVRSDAHEIPAQRLEFLVAQDLVHLVLRTDRLHWWRAAAWLLGVPVVIWLHLRYGILVSLPIGFLVCVAVWIAATAVITRISMRRVDGRLAEVFGEAWLADALQELTDVWTWRRDVRWLWGGALPQPPERLGWLKAAGTSS
jgi:hypothetical protein